MKFTSRERPEALLRAVTEYKNLAANPADMVWLFSLDEDDITADYELNQKIHSIIAPTKISIFIYHKKSKGKIYAINRDIDKFNLHWDILLNISDDQLPIVKGYDDVIREAMPENLDASLWFSDGHQDRINTQEIIGRVYFERHGFIYNPEYKSFFCDNEATERALTLRKCLKSSQCIIRHFHPQWDSSGTIKRDALYQKNDGYWKHDEAVYKRRKRMNFGL